MSSSSARKRKMARLSVLELRVAEWHRILSCKENHLTKLREDLTNLMEDLTKLREIADVKVEAQIADVKDVIADVKDEIAEMKDEIADAEAEIAKAEAEIAGIKDAELEADTSHDYFDFLSRLGAPSSLCKPENWRKAQEKPAYLCHIPPEAEPPFPLTLAHPAFANFVDRFNTSKIEFGGEECKLVVELCHLLTENCNNEREKMGTFNNLLGEYLGQKVTKIYVKSYNADGSVMSDGHMVYLGEGKKEEGNPLFQSMQYYGLLLSEMKKPERESTFCPCFLLELVGVHIRISGLAFFSKVACQPFTPFMHCYTNSYENTDMDSLCRAMLALKKGVFELKEYYRSPPPTVDKRIPYPLQEKQVRYVDRIGAKKLLFVVEMEQSRELRLFKYCRRYGKEVHEIWAQGHLAPKLFDCQEIQGGWIAVEMEYLSADDWKSVHQWCKHEPNFDKSELLQSASQALQTALNLNLQDKKFAHGDMRPTNIMARSVEGRFEIKFVDFDWAGDVSSTFYPSFMDTELNWHENVGPGMPLSQHHDWWWANKWIKGGTTREGFV